MPRIVFYTRIGCIGVAPLDLDDPHLKRFEIMGPTPREGEEPDERQRSSWDDMSLEILFVQSKNTWISHSYYSDHINVIYKEYWIEQSQLDAYRDFYHLGVPVPEELGSFVPQPTDREANERPGWDSAPQELRAMRRAHCDHLQQAPDVLREMIGEAPKRGVHITKDQNNQKINKYHNIYNCTLIGLRRNSALFMTERDDFLVADWWWVEDPEFCESGYHGSWRILSAQEAADWFGDDPELAPPKLRDSFQLYPTSSAYQSVIPADRPPSQGAISQADTHGPQVVLRGATDGPIVLGKERPRLTPAQYQVVKTLIDAFPDRLSKDELKGKSKVGDPIKVIDRLAKKDKDWAVVLYKPGQPHGGYGIVLYPPTKT